MPCKACWAESSSTSASKNSGQRQSSQHTRHTLQPDEDASLHQLYEERLACTNPR